MSAWEDFAQRQPRKQEARTPVASYGSGGGQPDDLVQKIHTFSSRVVKYEQLSRDIGTRKDNKELRYQVQHEREATKKLGEEISSQLKTSRGTRDRQQHDKLCSQYNVILKKFETVTLESQRKERQIVSRMSMAIQQGTPSSSAAVRMDDIDVEYGQQQQTTYDKGTLLTEREVLQEQTEDLENLESDLTSLQGMYLDLSTLVYDQQHDIDLIETHVTKAGSNVENGIDEVQKAAKYQKKTRKKMCCAIIMILVVTLGVILFFTVFAKK